MQISFHPCTEWIWITFLLTHINDSIQAAAEHAIQGGGGGGGSGGPIRKRHITSQPRKAGCGECGHVACELGVVIIMLLTSLRCAKHKTLRQENRLGVLPDFSPISLHDLLHASGDGFRSMVLCFLLLGAPQCAFCTLGCGLLFGHRSFLFSSLVPLLGVFPFIYLFRIWMKATIID
jgi:hypothetical protein